jgi:drug/metabolite transporter (DMT)-like permease/phosphatidylglycerophosphate synthase
MARLAAGASLISFSAVFVRIAHVSPAASGFYRVFFGGLILLAIAVIRRERLWNGRRSFLLQAGCGVFLFLDLVAWHTSILYIGPGLATLLANCQVFLLAAYGAAVLRERISLQLAIAVPLAFAGLYLLIGIQWEALARIERTGVYLGLFTAGCYAGFLVLLRRLQTRADPLSALANLAVISAATALLFSLNALREGESIRIPDVQSLVCVVSYGLFSQVVGWFLITRSLSAVRASLAGLLLLLQPSLSMLWDVLFFGRALTAAGACGAALTLAAIYLGTGGPREDRRRPPGTGRRGAGRTPNEALNRLHAEYRLTWVLSLLFLAAGTAALWASWGRAPALRWTVQAAGALALVEWDFGRSLALNVHPRHMTLRPTLGPATWVTLLRAALLAAMAGFIGQLPAGAAAHPGFLAWAPGTLYLTAAVLDYADGLIARLTGHETRLGERLDTGVDAFGLLLASLLLVWQGRAPWAYLGVGLGYYVLKAAVRLRRALGRPVARVAPRAGARFVAGCEMGFAGIALLPVVATQTLTRVAWVMTAALAAGLFKDWLVVCGAAAPDGRPLRPWFRAAERALTGALPVALRLGAAAGTFVTVFAGTRESPAAVLSAILIACAGLCVLGVATRVAAMILSLTTAALITAEPIACSASAVLLCSSALIMTGAGCLRWWQPEDRFLLERVGKG